VVTNNDNPKFHIHGHTTGYLQNILGETSKHINKKTSTTTKHSVDVTESAVY